MKPPKTLLLLSSLLLSAATARADLIVYDSFNYTLGTTSNDADAGLNGGNGLPYTNVGGNPSGTGTGLRNNWATGTIVTGLTYSGLATSGNAYLATGSNIVGTGDNPWIYRNMSTDPNASLRVGSVSSGNLGADGTTLYFSLLMQVDALPTNNGADRAVLELVGGSGRFAMGLPWSNTVAGNFGLANSGGATSFTSISASVDTTYFLVARLDSVAGNDTISLWVNPTIGSPLGTADATLSGIDFGGFSQFSPRFQGPSDIILDEVRIGTTWESVSPIPEPGTLALVGIALGSLLLFRKRR